MKQELANPLTLIPDRFSIDRMAKKKNPAAVVLGRLGGKKGGKARMALLTPDERSALARKAVRARWAKRDAAGGHQK